MRSLTLFAALFAVLATGPALVACKGVETKAEYPTNRQPGDPDTMYKRPSIFGDGGLNLFGGKKKGASEEGTGIGVNTYLWRASLDSISFMPINKADPFGGTILTDWYQAPNTPNERVKVNVLIMGKTLRTDALKVSLFRQAKVAGQWQDVAVDKATVSALEDTILTRARQLKVSAAQ